MTTEDNPLLDKSLEPIKDAPIATAHAIGAVALNLALKYHGITTITDGAMYQQYKLEGRNMHELHIDMVFETAIAMEKHLLGTSERIAKLVVDALDIAVDERDEPPAERKEGDAL